MAYLAIAYPGFTVEIVMRKKTKKQLKEERRVIVQRARQRKNWKPPKGMVIFADKY